MIAAYISSHGFGHVTRSSEVLRAVRELRPDLALTIVSAAPEDLFRSAIGDPVDVRGEECDVGLVQRGALTIDAEASAERLEAFLATWDERVEREAEWLRSSGADLVYGDIPPLAFEAAARAGLPSVALGNFSWDWIYAHFARHAPRLAAGARWAADAYRKASLLMRLPFAGDMGVFPCAEDVPLVARRPTLETTEARRRITRDPRAIVVLSFGGHGLFRFDPQVLAQHSDYQFVVPNTDPRLPENVLALTEDERRARGLSYADVVAAAEVVVTKPGYGIVTDAISGHSRLVYTDRGDFPEYPLLVAEMVRYLPCVYVSNEDLSAGRIGEAIAAVRQLRFPDPPRLDGAEVVARRVLATLDAARAATARQTPGRTSSTS